MADGEEGEKTSASDPRPGELSALERMTRDRDSLAAELAELRGNSRPTSAGNVNVTSAMLSTLSLLRSHIDDLTRDNEALRYTFLGLPFASDQHAPTASSAQESTAAPSAPSRSARPVVDGVDLEDVVKRVKELMRENEELGEIIMEAGKTRSDEWQEALDESRDVITNLNVELDHRVRTIQALELMLSRYKSYFGPLPMGDTAEQPASPHSPTGSIGNASAGALSDAGEAKSPHRHHVAFGRGAKGKGNAPARRGHQRRSSRGT